MVTGTGLSGRVYVRMDDGGTFACYAADLDLLPDRTEPHDDREGMSAADILEKVAERLANRAASTGKLVYDGVAEELRAVAAELRR